jgi:hypothetical protein
LGKPLTELHPRSFSKTDLVEWWMANRSMKIGDCIVPTSSQKRDYPQVRMAGRSHHLHRLSYEVFKGSTRGMDVHHVRANSRCFNPEHLELASRRANVAEMKERTAYKRRISELEEALAALDPLHTLLEGI